MAEHDQLPQLLVGAGDAALVLRRGGGRRGGGAAALRILVAGFMDGSHYARAVDPVSNTITVLNANTIVYISGCRFVLTIERVRNFNRCHSAPAAPRRSPFPALDEDCNDEMCALRAPGGRHARRCRRSRRRPGRHGPDRRLGQGQSGGVLPGVTVTATQTGTGVMREAVSDADGAYFLPNLPIGPYRLEAALAGFRTFVQTGIVLQVNANPTVNVVMGLGAVSEQITVQGNAAMVETRTTSVGQVMENQRILELPLNGRQVTDLLLPRPA